MTNETYNGWTNYATWRVNLEIFDGQTAEDLGIQKMDAYDAVQYLKSYVEEILEQQVMIGGRGASSPLVLDYAMAFISDVNWHNIAKHLLEEYQEKEEETA